MGSRQRVISLPVARRHRKADGAFGRVLVDELLQQTSPDAGNPIGGVDEELEALERVAILDEEA